MAKRGEITAASQRGAEVEVARMARNREGVFAVREEMTGPEISDRMSDVHKLRLAVELGDRAWARRVAEEILASLR